MAEKAERVGIYTDEELENKVLENWSTGGILNYFLLREAFFALVKDFAEMTERNPDGVYDQYVRIGIQETQNTFGIGRSQKGDGKEPMPDVFPPPSGLCKAATPEDFE